MRTNRGVELNFRESLCWLHRVGIGRRAKAACGQAVDYLCGAGETPEDTISWGWARCAREPPVKLFGRFLIALLLQILL